MVDTHQAIAARSGIAPRVVGRELVESAVMAADIIVTTTCSIVAFMLYYLPRYGGAELLPRYLLLGLLGGVFLLQIGRIKEWYKVKQLTSFSTQVAPLCLGWSFAALLVATAIFLLKLGDEFSRGWFLAWWLLGLPTLMLGRMVAASVITSLQRQGALRRRTAIVGTGERAAELLRQLQSDELATQFAVVGVYDAEDEPAGAADATRPAIATRGTVADLADYVRGQDLDVVIVAAERTAPAAFRDLVERVRELPADVWLLSDPISVPLAKPTLDFVGAMPVLTVAEKPLKNWDLVAKRVIDVLMASILLFLLAPLFALVSLAIKLDSRGPVFFKQQRFGFGGRSIEVFKFRSMRTDLGDASGAQRTIQGDPRVTRVGRFIRRTSIDELPQLINVLRGDMSMVGPRAHPIAMKVGDKYYHQAVRRYAARHRVLPGITGWAQVNGSRGEIATMQQAQRRVELDLYYIENWSLALDLKILAMTVATVLSTKNAY
jgi:Undecaprenyl-phosphate glucose phosphotransferase